MMSQKKWMENFFRFGLISKGVVYCLLGILTVMAAVGFSREKGSKTAAFETIYEQPFGKIILIVLVIGITGYITMRSFQAFKDIDNKGNDFKAIITRMGYAFSALVYLGLGIYAVRLLMGNGSSGSSSQKTLIAKAFEMPGGQWLVGIAALIIIGGGINQIHKGISGRFMKRVKLYWSEKQKLFKNAGTAGYISRGIVLAVVGYLLLHGAITLNPDEGQGTDQAFDFLANTGGNLLMALVAAGLVAYGVFMFVRAKFQNFHTENF